MVYFNLNCQGFLDRCRRIQLPVREEVFQVQGDILLGGIEEFRHLKLRQPNGLILGAELDLAPAVFRGVEDELHHADT